MENYVGTDPEFIIRDKNRNPVPAWELFPDKAHKLGFGKSKHNGLFRDGFALELNVPPSYCRENLILYMLRGLQAARRKLPKGFTLSSTPTVEVDLKKILKNAPADAMVFGCEPSWNAYTGEFDSVPLDATEHPFRYAGGHMHISWKKTDIDKSETWAWVKDTKSVRKYVKLLDNYLALPLSAWYNRPGTFSRREFYGQAGDYRLQDYGGAYYGIEYRTPGPEVWNSPVVASWAYGVMRAVATQFERLSKAYTLKRSIAVRRAVNTGLGVSELLSGSFISPLGSPGCSKADFIKIVSYKRPFQSLLTVNPPRSEVYSYWQSDKRVHQVGWGEFIGTYEQDEIDCTEEGLGVDISDMRLVPCEEAA